MSVSIDYEESNDYGFGSIRSNPIPLYCQFNGDRRSTPKILDMHMVLEEIITLELFVCLNKEARESVRIVFLLFDSPSFFPDQANKKFLLF